jgi:GrpB-like predicted nucleotidyltransferase (UPF0157 family)
VPVTKDSAGSLDSVLIGGIEKREIALVDHDPRWAALFEEQAERIRGALSGTVVSALEHIGSTAVPGLAAKPIIDVLLAVTSSADEPSYLPALEAAGYELRVRDPADNEHRMLRTPTRDVHIHVYSLGCAEILRCVSFRDRLRAHAGDRALYERTKRELVARGFSDMNAYAAAKTQVIEEILRRAGEAGVRRGV